MTLVLSGTVPLTGGTDPPQVTRTESRPVHTDADKAWEDRVPRRLVGRLAGLTWLNCTARPPGATLVLTGRAGAGKTALARTWCEENAARFPGGLLRLGLEGFAGGTPITTQEALARLLRGLGVPRDRIPTAQRERRRLYRRLLAERSPLLLLDDAATEQVLPLLPRNDGRLTVVTSRATLPDWRPRWERRR